MSQVKQVLGYDISEEEEIRGRAKYNSVCIFLPSVARSIDLLQRTGAAKEAATTSAGPQLDAAASS